MYIHPRTTEIVPFGGSVTASAASNMDFKQMEVSGQSEVRPIVTLKRSKTTVGQYATPHYRPGHTLQRTFRGGSVAKQIANRYDHNHNNIYATNKRKSPGGGHQHFLQPTFDDICEFQVKIIN